MRNGKQAEITGLNGSASIKGKQLVLTIANPSLDQVREAAIHLRGAKAASVKAVELAAADPHAHNTFDAPRMVEPKPTTVDLRAGVLNHRFPPASVTKLEIALA
jgi:alpha-N-arabinofuranosidase